jgi:fatty acid desaturase
MTSQSFREVFELRHKGTMKPMPKWGVAMLFIAIVVLGLVIAYLFIWTIVLLISFFVFLFTSLF